MSAAWPAALPTRRLGGIYFAYFAALGCLVPYFSRYLSEQGFGPAAIGGLMALLSGARTLSPFLASLLAERGGRQLLMRLALVLASLLFCGLFVVREPWALTGVLIGFHLCFSAVLPQMETLTLAHLGAQAPRYGRIRLWGSIGYMLCVVIAGAWFDALGIGQLPFLVLLALLVCSGFAFSLPDAHPKSAPREGEEASWGTIWRNPAPWLLFAACFCQQAATQPYYLFYDLLLTAQGYSGFHIGLLIALGVLAEIGMFMVIGRHIERHGLSRLMAAVALVAVLRWWLTGAWPESRGLMLAVNGLHAVTFAAAHALAMYALAATFPANLQGRAQGLFASVVYGLGGIVGALLAGHLSQRYGWGAAFYGAAGLCVLAFLLMLFSRERR
ncbi:MAG: MFS transporter [Gammaproteobacteria bacterium]|nr:MFS transporter [Gammaproteobacteria bacterium]